MSAEFNALGITDDEPSSKSWGVWVIVALLVIICLCAAGGTYSSNKYRQKIFNQDNSVPNNSVDESDDEYPKPTAAELAASLKTDSFWGQEDGESYGQDSFDTDGFAHGMESMDILMDRVSNPLSGDTSEGAVSLEDQKKAAVPGPEAGLPLKFDQETSSDTVYLGNLEVSPLNADSSAHVCPERAEIYQYGNPIKLEVKKVGTVMCRTAPMPYEE